MLHYYSKKLKGKYYLTQYNHTKMLFISKYLLPKKHPIYFANYKYILQKEYYAPCCICYEEYKKNNNNKPYDCKKIAEFEFCEFLNHIRFDNQQICICNNISSNVMQTDYKKK